MIVAYVSRGLFLKLTTLIYIVHPTLRFPDTLLLSCYRFIIFLIEVFHCCIHVYYSFRSSAFGFHPLCTGAYCIFVHSCHHNIIEILTHKDKIRWYRIEHVHRRRCSSTRCVLLSTSSTMPKKARIHFVSLRSSLVNLPISIYGPLVERNVVSTVFNLFVASGSHFPCKETPTFGSPSDFSAKPNSKTYSGTNRSLCRMDRNGFRVLAGAF